MTELPSQKMFWNQKHAQGVHEALRKEPNPFAVVAEKRFQPRSMVLDLACGVAGDAIYFAQQGHHVVATDISDVVIQQNLKYDDSQAVEYLVLDTEQPFPFDSGSFDVVYSHLGLHYSTNEKTNQTFGEIWRVLKSGGIVAFNVKSVNDQHFKRSAQEIEPNVLVSASGHLRHFFTEHEIKQLLTDKFDVQLLKAVQEDYTGDLSDTIRCVAKKVTKQ